MRTPYDSLVFIFGSSSRVVDLGLERSGQKAPNGRGWSPSPGGDAPSPPPLPTRLPQRLQQPQPQPPSPSAQRPGGREAVSRS